MVVVVVKASEDKSAFSMFRSRPTALKPAAGGLSAGPGMLMEEDRARPDSIHHELCSLSLWQSDYCRPLGDRVRFTGRRPGRGQAARPRAGGGQGHQQRTKERERARERERERERGREGGRGRESE